MFFLVTLILGSEWLYFHRPLAEQKPINTNHVRVMNLETDVSVI